jgi:NADH:ubiquinone oxidoreductase subunit 3 (subunit A)
MCIEKISSMGLVFLHPGDLSRSDWFFFLAGWGLILFCMMAAFIAMLYFAIKYLVRRSVEKSQQDRDAEVQKGRT